MPSLSFSQMTRFEQATVFAGTLVYGRWARTSSCKRFFSCTINTLNFEVDVKQLMHYRWHCTSVLILFEPLFCLLFAGSFPEGLKFHMSCGTTPHESRTWKNWSLLPIPCDKPVVSLARHVSRCVKASTDSLHLSLSLIGTVFVPQSGKSA